MREVQFWIPKTCIKIFSIICCAFPTCPTKCKLHVKTTCRHHILCWIPFPSNEWNGISRTYTCRYMDPINRSNAILYIIITLNINYIFVITTSVIIIIQTLFHLKVRHVS
ncbi:hypothetical protein CFOL_v3_01306 [Cephalotus follicularis]|uniref:Uncharacterized protein n=1 Tax=Cephalotus follicularis TaxID=3775 RepID=A0A1Q3AQ59_CEPFO|nr:hypothetical protein CFOL_v3_01306 [Cephalotus follicularis]